MGILDTIKNKLKKMFSIAKGQENESNAQFVQWIHPNMTKTHCPICTLNHERIFENTENKPPIGKYNHPLCECYYKDVEQKNVGTISNKGILSPDVYLKAYGKLPDYYITKKEARELGWNQGKNLSHFAPGKMIGGDIYKNKPPKLPEKEGRIWYECDIDYEINKRNSKRLYYSNDGLMFYSPDHRTTFYYIN